MEPIALPDSSPTTDEKAPVDPEESTALCPHCAEAVEPFDHFCPFCGGPVTAHASIDPLGQVYALGHGYQRAVSSRPRLIVVLGMWLIFGPQLLFLLMILFKSLTAVVDISALIPGNQTPNAPTVGHLDMGSMMIALVGYSFTIMLAAIYGAILWTVTKRYRKARPGCCIECGYDLRGSVGAKLCPECGAAIDPML